MADDELTPAQVYGDIGNADRAPPAPEGMRGEGSEAEGKGVHRLLAAGGRTVEVEEASGVAAAEAAGTSGLSRDTGG